MKIHATSRPALKTGTSLFPLSASPDSEITSTLFVGRPDHGIEITAPHALAILRAFTGAWDCQEISGRLGAPLKEVIRLASLLFAAGLIDLSHTAIVQSGSTSVEIRDDTRDISQQQLLMRISRESALTTWRDGSARNCDHGISLLQRRKNWEVEFFSHSPLSYRIHRSLDASGIGRTHLTDSPDGKSSVTSEEIDLAHFPHQDLGRPIHQVLSDISRNIRLFPARSNRSLREESADAAGASTLVITPADLAATAMWHQRPHLIYRISSLSQVEIGPLVLPGHTPCWRCVQLQRSDHDRLWSALYQAEIAEPEIHRQLEKRLPHAVLDFLTGLITVEVLEFIDTGKCALTHGAIALSLTPKFSFQQIAYVQHPRCGCRWRESSAEW